MISIERFDQNAVGDQFTDALLHPPLSALGEDGLEVAFEEGAGVLEVLFGVGFGGGETRKRFVQDADDPLLLGRVGTGIGTCPRLPLLIRFLVVPVVFSSTALR